MGPGVRNFINEIPLPRINFIFMSEYLELQRIEAIANNIKKMARLATLLVESDLEKHVRAFRVEVDVASLYQSLLCKENFGPARYSEHFETAGAPFENGDYLLSMFLDKSRLIAIPFICDPRIDLTGDVDLSDRLLVFTSNIRTAKFRINRSKHGNHVTIPNGELKSDIYLATLADIQ